MTRIIYSFLLLWLLFIPVLSFASDSGLVIDEFQIGKTGASNDEYIVIANYGSNEIKIDGFNLRTKRNSSSITTPVVDSNLYLFPDGANLFVKPGERLIVAKSGYSSMVTPYTYTGYISSNYTIYLNDETDSLIDLVGFGDAPVYETQPITVVKADEVWKRINRQDNNNNFLDFTNLNAPMSISSDPNIKNIQISELLPNPANGSEWIELYNPTNFEVNLYGLKVCDRIGKTHCYSFTSSDSISPLSYKTYLQTVTRITLNNDSDGVELLDVDGNVLSETAEYDNAADDESFSLFGSVWKWSTTLTPNKTNILTDTVETEKKSNSKSKTKVTKASQKKEASENNKAEINEDSTEVKGSNNLLPETEVKNEKTKKIGQKELGWSVLALAVIIFIGYFANEYKANIYEFYLKIRGRNT